MFAVGGYLLLWVAIYNGYPIVFSDSGEYLSDSFALTQTPYRSIVYSIFIRLVSWGMTPWLVVLAQCVLTMYVLHCAFRYIARLSPQTEADPFVFLGLTIFLAVGTSLPWYVGQIMPDVFSGLAFLCIFLLLYEERLPRERAVLLSTALLVSAGSHLSNFPSLGLVLLAVLVLRAFHGTRQFWPVRGMKEILALVLLPLVGSAGLVTLSNVRAGYGFRLSAGSQVFMMARLMESGLAEDYLDQQCKVENLTPCKHLQELRTVRPNELLWGKYPLLTEMGGWTGAGPEAGRIVAGTIRRYPMRFLLNCVGQTGREFAVFTAKDEYFQVQGFTLDTLNRLYSGEVSKYQVTKQWYGRLRGTADKLYRLDEAVFWICLCGGMALLIGRWSAAAPANRLFLLTLIYLVANAFVTGSASGVFDRYQGRVNWLMAFSCVASVVPLVLNRWGGREEGL